MSNDIPKLILIRGLPGSGKSTLSNYLSHEISAVIVDPDLINFHDLFLFCCLNLKDIFQYFPKGIKLLKFRLNLQKTLHLLLAGKTVIWCQMFSSKSGLKYIIKYLEKRDALKEKPVIIDLNCNKQLILKRCVNRNWITPITLEELITKYEDISDLADYASLLYESSEDKEDVLVNKIILKLVR